MLSVLAGIGLGLSALAVDSRIGEHSGGLPLGLTSTVESARSVLSTIAGATITFAGIAFSISLLVIQLASSQYSPRVVHTLFRDPFNKRVMGLVVGTFTYCVDRAAVGAVALGGGWRADHPQPVRGPRRAARRASTVHPAGPTGGVRAADGQVQALQGGLLAEGGARAQRR
jgi:hypothetical protein